MAMLIVVADQKFWHNPSHPLKQIAENAHDILSFLSYFGLRGANTKPHVFRCCSFWGCYFNKKEQKKTNKNRNCKYREKKKKKRVEGEVKCRKEYKSIEKVNNSQINIAKLEFCSLHFQWALYYCQIGLSDIIFVIIPGTINHTGGLEVTMDYVVT